MKGSRFTLSPSLVLVVVGTGAFITALDQTVVVTALPSIMLDLNVSIFELDRASWIITAYLLGYTSAMPLIGRMADVYGYTRVYQASLFVFCIGTCLVALSPNFECIIAARVVQAVGGGATVPIGLAMGSGVRPAGQRGMALAIVAAAAEAGTMLGPVYGGAIVELLGWRWIFWLNVPQAALVSLALVFAPMKGTGTERVDYLGGVLLTATLVMLTLALSMDSLFTLASATPYVIGGLGLLMGATLVVLHRRAGQPLLAPALFRSAALVSANVTQLLVGVALIIGMVTVPLMANTVMGQTPFTGALWLLRMTAAIPVGAIVGGKLLSHIGVRPVTVVGLVLAAAGMLFLSTWEVGVGEPWLSLHLALAGLGFGLVIAPILVRVIEGVPDEHRAAAASFVVVARMVGMTLGLAALAAWGVDHFQGLMSGVPSPLLNPGSAPGEFEQRMREYEEALTAAGFSVFRGFLRAGAAVLLVAVIPAVFMASAKPHPDGGGHLWEDRRG